MPANLQRLDPAARAALEELQIQGEPSIYLHLVDVFLRTAEEYIAEVKSRSDDIGAVREAAHALRSASASIGAQLLAELCAQMEAERSLLKIKAMSAQLESEFLEVRNLLQAGKAA